MNRPTQHPRPAPLMLAPSEGQRIPGDARLLAALDHPAYASTFEMTVNPGFDVGAHRHHGAEEMFFVLDGELDLLCLDPLDRANDDWHTWRSATGQTYLRGGAGAFMYVPPATPHAFANRSDAPARILFQSTVRGGHESYLTEMARILTAAHGDPDPDVTADLRARFDTEQLTAMKHQPSAPGY